MKPLPSKGLTVDIISNCKKKLWADCLICGTLITGKIFFDYLTTIYLKYACGARIWHLTALRCWVNCVSILFINFVFMKKVTQLSDEHYGPKRPFLFYSAIISSDNEFIAGYWKAYLNIFHFA